MHFILFLLYIYSTAVIWRINSLGHFGDESLQFAVSHLHWYWQPNHNNQETEHVQNTNQCKTKSGHTKQQTLKKPKLRERTDRAWFSRLLRHPVRKQTERVYSYNPVVRTGQPQH